VPVSMTFNSLQSDLRAYLERGNVADVTVYDQLPSLINIAERRIARELKILGTLNVASSNMAAGTPTYLKPDRWLRTASINYTVGSAPNARRVQMYPRGYEYCRMLWPNPDEQDADFPPEFYADYDFLNWLFVPTPNDAYEFEVVYWQQPPLLDNANQTNWLTDYAPDVLLYGSLLQATPFLKNDERISVWEGFYEQGKTALNMEDLNRIIARGSPTRQET
jgi:hypothetical protein